MNYDRRIHQENGFILSGNYEWTVKQAKKEMKGYASYPLRENERIWILADKKTDISMFGQGKRRRITLNYNLAPLWLMKAAIARWSVNVLSTNGRTMKRHIDMVIKAVENLVQPEDTRTTSLSEEADIEHNKNIEKFSYYMERFLSQMGETEQRALKIRPFVSSYEFQVTVTEYGTVY